MATTIHCSSISSRAEGRGQAATCIREEGEARRKVVLGVVEKETIEEAFSYLKERLDPELDVFEAATKFRQMTWSPARLSRSSLLGEATRA